MAQEPRARLVPTGQGRLVLYRQALSHGAFAVVPFLLTVSVVLLCVHKGFLATDFHEQYWVAGHRTLHGGSPFDESYHAIHTGRAFPYSALDALVFAGFAVIPRNVGDWLFTALNMAALLTTLRVLRVTDWRLYGLVFLWAPVVVAWQTANVTLLLGLGLAYLWTHRDQTRAAGLILAVLVTVKLIVWPLGLWLLATRRYRAAAWAVGATAALNALTWLVVGLDQIAVYRRVLDAVTRYEEHRSYTIMSAALHAGAGRGLAYAAGFAVAAAIAALAVRAGRQGRDTTSFILCVGVGLLATPVVWLHYAALLAVPLALVHPRLSAAWLLPLLMWVCPSDGPADWELAAGLACTTLVMVLVVRAADGAAIAPGAVTPVRERLDRPGPHGVVAHGMTAVEPGYRSYLDL